MNVSSLISFNSLGIYYVRELSLIKDPDYLGIQGNREKYKTKIITNLENTFNQNNLFINDILASKLLYENKLDQFNLYNDLYLKFYPIYVQIALQNIQNSNLRVMNSTSNYLNFLIETNAALYRITTKELQNTLTVKDKDLFFYIYNSMNYLVSNSRSIFEKLSLKYIDQVARNRYDYIYVVLSFNIVCVASYFITSYSYNFVADKKESYLTVFFEIGDSVIKTNIESVNEFIKQISVR